MKKKWRECYEKQKSRLLIEKEQFQKQHDRLPREKLKITPNDIYQVVNNDNDNDLIDLQFLHNIRESNDTTHTIFEIGK